MHPVRRLSILLFEVVIENFFAVAAFTNARHSERSAGGLAGGAQSKNPVAYQRLDRKMYPRATLPQGYLDLQVVHLSSGSFDCAPPTYPPALRSR